MDEIGDFTRLRMIDGAPSPPNIKTLQIDLIAVLYSAYLNIPSRCELDGLGDSNSSYQSRPALFKAKGEPWT